MEEEKKKQKSYWPKKRLSNARLAKVYATKNEELKERRRHMFQLTPDEDYSGWQECVEEQRGMIPEGIPVKSFEDTKDKLVLHVRHVAPFVVGENKKIPFFYSFDNPVDTRHPDYSPSLQWTLIYRLLEVGFWFENKKKEDLDNRNEDAESEFEKREEICRMARTGCDDLEFWMDGYENPGHDSFKEEEEDVTKRTRLVSLGGNGKGHLWTRLFKLPSSKDKQDVWLEYILSRCHPARWNPSSEMRTKVKAESKYLDCVFSNRGSPTALFVYTEDELPMYYGFLSKKKDTEGNDLVQVGDWIETIK